MLSTVSAIKARIYEAQKALEAAEKLSLSLEREDHYATQEFVSQATDSVGRAIDWIASAHAALDSICEWALSGLEQPNAGTVRDMRSTSCMAASPATQE